MCPETKQSPQNDAERPAPGRRDTTYPMLPRLRDDSLEVLHDLGPALEQVMPLKTKHLADLPRAVRELSEQLTSERGGLTGKYLQTPRTLSAYIRYFLPWNVYRQARLFAGLWLRLHDGARILDLGSGPLTAPMALWAARPDLRKKNITFVCVDRTAKALKIGEELFNIISKGSERWTLELVEAPLEQALRAPGLPYDMIFFGNVLNELRWGGDDPMEAGVVRIAEYAVQRLHAKRQPHLLAVEPGTRLGGRLVSLLRKAAQDLGLTSLSPCTHQNLCPMLARRANSWCHFRCTPEGIPQWLRELSDKAGLPKETLAMSFIHLSAVTARQEDKARILSNPLRLQQQGHFGYYACTKRGQLIIEEQGRPSLQQGDLSEYEMLPGKQLDPKSGVPRARLPQAEQSDHAPTKARPKPSSNTRSASEEAARKSAPPKRSGRGPNTRRNAPDAGDSDRESHSKAPQARKGPRSKSGPPRGKANAPTSGKGKKPRKGD